MTQLLSDRVWAQLDPHAGRLSRRRSRWLLLGIVLAAVAVALLVPTLHSGLIEPHLKLTAHTKQFPELDGPPSTANPFDFSVVYTLTNTGTRPITVTGIGRQYSEAAVVAPTTKFPRRIAPGRVIRFTIRYEITSCSPFATHTFNPYLMRPEPVRVKRAWGTQTVLTSVGDQLLVNAADVCGSFN